MPSESEVHREIVKAGGWDSVRKYYDAALLSDPYPKDPVKAAFEFTYWRWLHQLKIRQHEDGTEYTYDIGWLHGRIQGLQEGRIRSGGSQWMANWERGKLREFLIQQYRKVLPNLKINMKFEYSWSDGLTAGKLIGISRALNILAGDCR
jgi:hypothetical protein